MFIRCVPKVLPPQPYIVLLMEIDVLFVLWKVYIERNEKYLSTYNSFQPLPPNWGKVENLEVF